MPPVRGVQESYPPTEVEVGMSGLIFLSKSSLNHEIWAITWSPYSRASIEAGGVRSGLS